MDEIQKENAVAVTGIPGEGKAPEVLVGEQHVAERPQRWESAFDALMTYEIVDRLLTLRPFSEIDASKFPKHQSLRDILLNDTRVLKMSSGQVVVREGEYGNSAYLILSGKARVILDSLPGSDIGRGASGSRNLLTTLARVFRRSIWPETRVHYTQRKQAIGAQQAVFLQDVPAIISKHRTAEIHAGEIFGEMSALGRTPRAATIIAGEDESEFLEMRWQGLRDLMIFAPEFREQIEARFRQNGLSSVLRGLEIIHRLPKESVDEIVKVTKFERYGNFDWYGSYEKMRETKTATERLSGEPLIIKEGDYINGLVIVRAGFVRVSRSYNQSEQTTSYLGKGQHFGLQEILHNSKNPDSVIAAQRSLRAIGYVDILLIPIDLVEKYIIPSLTPLEVQSLALKAPQAVGGTSQEIASLFVDDARSHLGAGTIEFFMDKRTINGSATMLIDLSRCTRCDDCVRACAATHDGNPRFIRHGDSNEGIQVVQACMHCADPICMIPCPTGAIHRLEAGEVVINDNTCIGCARCANNCPYDNIQMVDIRDGSGNFQYPVRLNAKGEIVRDNRGQMIPITDEGPIRRATKCDLCFEYVGGPSCVRACPHDAMVRMDMQDTDLLTDWISR